MECFHSVSLNSLVLIPCSDGGEATKDVNADAECSPASRRGEILNGSRGGSKTILTHKTLVTMFE